MICEHSCYILCVGIQREMEEHHADIEYAIDFVVFAEHGMGIC
jgi:hypothetical protein